MKKPGFTILEVIIYVAVFSIFSLVLISIYLNLIKSQKEGQDLLSIQYNINLLGAKIDHMFANDQVKCIKHTPRNSCGHDNESNCHWLIYDTGTIAGPNVNSLQVSNEETNQNNIWDVGEIPLLYNNEVESLLLPNIKILDFQVYNLSNATGTLCPNPDFPSITASSGRTPISPVRVKFTLQNIHTEYVKAEFDKVY